MTERPHKQYGDDPKFSSAQIRNMVTHGTVSGRVSHKVPNRSAYPSCRVAHEHPNLSQIAKGERTTLEIVEAIAKTTGQKLTRKQMIARAEKVDAILKGEQRVELKPTIIHVNQLVIRSNAKHGTNEPPLTFRKGRNGRKSTRAHTVTGEGPFELVYSPHNPLPCGARLWIETYGKVTHK